MGPGEINRELNDRYYPKEHFITSELA